MTRSSVPTQPISTDFLPEDPLILFGFMGCGKTTVGRNLAARLSIPFFDTDHWIEARMGRTVSEIFAREGEAGFRRYELKALRSALEEKGPRVVALGGGTLTLPKARALLKNQLWMIFLEQDIAEAYRRANGPKRPLAGNFSQFKALYKRRLKTYRRFARFTISVEGKTGSQVAYDLIEKLELVRPAG